MTKSSSEWPNLDYTAKGIQFASWPTIVENDDLYLGRVDYYPKGPLISFADGLTLSMPLERAGDKAELEAFFVSSKSRAVIKFTFNRVLAFRVLDEKGFLDIAAASWPKDMESPRPARTTYRVRGHLWQKESFLLFMSDDLSPRFSYMIDTDDECLEVVCLDEPVVSDIGPAIVTHE